MRNIHIPNKYTEIILIAAVFIGLYLTSLYNYLLFHSLAEIFSILVACGIFMIAWNSRRFLDNNYIMFIGIAYLFVGGLDLVHTFAYKGMNIFQGYDSNLPTQLWVSARYVESFTLLIAPLMLGRTLKSNYIIIGYMSVTSLLLVSIFYWGIFPDCFIEGTGLTEFKKTSEYAISLILFASVILLLIKRNEFDKGVMQLLATAIFITIGAELAFTFYVSVYDFSNLIGHFLKIISFYLIYKAIIVTGLTRPYDLMFRNLKKNEEDMKRSMDYAQMIIDSIGDPTIVIDPASYRILLANKAMRDQLDGLDLAAMSMVCYQVRHGRDTPFDESGGMCPMKQVISSRKPVRVTHCYRNADNNIVFDDILATPVFDREGNLTQVIESIRDITDIKLAEIALQQERDRAQKYLDVVGVLIVVINTDQKVTLINKRTSEILGYEEEEEIIGKNWFDTVIPERIRGTVRDVFEKLIAGEIKPVEYYENPVLTRDGEERLIAWHNFVLRDGEGNITSTLSSGEDITERRKADEKLQETRDYLDKLIQYANAPIIVWDPDLKITRFNGAFEHLTGYRADEVIGQELSILFPETSREESLQKIYRTLSGEYWKSVEIPILRKDGGVRLSLWNSANIYAEAGTTLLATIAQGMDITERKRAEREVQKYAEELHHSNELKDLFTDILHHDLLNPAGIIRGYTEVLLNSEKEEKKIRALKKIERNNEKLIEIIETAARFARFETVKELEFDKRDIGLIFQDVVENFRPQLKAKNMILEFRAEEEYPAKVNQVIEEVFANLLSNAIKYSPEGSRIIIDIIDADENWKITVTDFGVGISNKDKPTLFERFKRVNKGGVKGIGLGLAIIKRIIDLHEGSVGIEDNPEGQGCVFWVTVKKA